MVLSNIGAFEERTGCRVDIGRANVYVWPATRRVTLTGEGRCPDVARLEIEALLVKHDQVRDAWLQKTHLFFGTSRFRLRQVEMVECKYARGRGRDRDKD